MKAPEWWIKSWRRRNWLELMLNIRFGDNPRCRCMHYKYNHYGIADRNRPTAIHHVECSIRGCRCVLFEPELLRQWIGRGISGDDGSSLPVGMVWQSPNRLAAGRHDPFAPDARSATPPQADRQSLGGERP